MWLSLALILPLAPLGVATQSFVSATTLIAFLFAIGGGIAVGPVLLGAAKPVHVLTASATVRRIVNMTALTVADAEAGRASGPAA